MKTKLKKIVNILSRWPRVILNCSLYKNKTFWVAYNTSNTQSSKLSSLCEPR